MARHEFPDGSYVKLNIKHNVGQWILKIITFNQVSRKKVKARFKRRKGKKLSMYLQSTRVTGTPPGRIATSETKEKSCSDCKKLTLKWTRIGSRGGDKGAIAAFVRGTHPNYGRFEVTETTGHPDLLYELRESAP